MSIVSSRQVYNIINRVMDIMSHELLEHGHIVSYIMYKMLQADGNYSRQEMTDYALLALLHDIGTMKTGYRKSLSRIETDDLWGHSIYGYLFLRYLSPLYDKAEIVLYHHLNYNKHHFIKSRYIKEAEYLQLADKMDVFMREKNKKTHMDADYFKKNVNITFSDEALQMFYKAQEKYHITERLSSGEYLTELERLFNRVDYDDEDIRMFLQMIVYSIDFRSQQTVLHALGTTTYAECIGKIMGLRDRKLEELYYGALLHDIGKIAIPLEILEAPRRLNDQEMRVMKAHVLITERILQDTIDEDIYMIAIRHHEKMDGTGYPNGIKGDELTLSQQIMTVADVLSALRGKRSYKDEMPKEKILSIITEDAEKNKLSRKVADVLVARYDDIMNYYDGHMVATQSTYMEILEQYESIYSKFRKFE